MSERLDALSIYPGRVFNLAEPLDVILIRSVPDGSTFLTRGKAVWRKTADGVTGWVETIKGRGEVEGDLTLKLIALSSGSPV